ncbi:hypothetical protein C2845_PM12G15570 [Panicum miliaceum]|uniref:Pectinesterase inhibitor domain-containing protein n=1 Tax=Panicum miliaceum TaxID=4540 RepID=A0A3L6QEJ7_PANMI|nr:hypothetical protein C2845_PM12G15570 [Panicum miliaceum]
MAAARTTSSALLLFAAAVVVLAAHATAAADLVSQACTNATRHFCRLQLSKDSCVSALRSDERSAAARDLRDLALVAVDLVGASAAAADAAISAAAAKGGGADTERSLQYCRVDYDDMARTVPDCRRLVSRYDAAVVEADGGPPSQYYFGCVDRLRDSAVGCWDQVRNWAELKKAVGKEVRDVVQRANVAKLIQEQMLGMENPFESLHD